MLLHHESSQGLKAIEQVPRRYGDSGNQNLRFETIRVDYSGDMAIEMGRYTLCIETGNKTVTDAGKYLRAWHRLGAWRIVGDAWSSDLPVDYQGVTFGGGTRVA